MNELQRIKTERQTPIEIALQVDSQGMTTASALYEFLELNPSNYSKWASRNIVKNQFATEGADYLPFVLHDERNPKPTTDYQLTAAFAKKLCMVSKSPRGEEARDYFIMVEQNLKQVVTTLTAPKTQMELLAAIAQQWVEKERQDAERDHQLRLQASRLDQVEAKIEKRITDDFSLQLVTPTQLGKMWEPAISGQEVNKRLRAAGLQWSVGGEWVSTVEGKKYSSSEPVQLEGGKMIYQLKWQRRVKGLIG
jgi:phage anti-repressor protein